MASDRQFDVVVFGATGFTGHYVVRYLHTLCVSKLSWAVAGRSRDKLQRLLNDVTGSESPNIPILEADVANDESLEAMCRQTRLVINVVGPYRFYGEPVVKACVNSGTHHVDICGEPQWLERMALEYGEKARNAGVYIMQACGFDSIPAELGILNLRNKFPGDLNSVEQFVSIHPGPDGMAFNYGTWQSAIYGVAHGKELGALRKKLYTNPIPKSNHRLKSRGVFFRAPEVNNQWCLPFPTADKPVVYRSQYHNYEQRHTRPVQMQGYVVVPSLFVAVAMMLMAVVFGILVQFSFGRSLLENYPAFFSAGLFRKSGPTPEQVKSTTFKLTLVGRGYKDRVDDPNSQHPEPPTETTIATVSGPECGYVATSLLVVEAALTVLNQQDRLPNRGGVFTPAAAFQDTDLIKRLQTAGIEFTP